MKAPESHPISSTGSPLRFERSATLLVDRKSWHSGDPLSPVGRVCAEDKGAQSTPLYREMRAETVALDGVRRSNCRMNYKLEVENPESADSAFAQWTGTNRAAFKARHCLSRSLFPNYRNDSRVCR